MGDPWRLFYGADSFGNSCGRRNAALLREFHLSGQDASDASFLFSMDILRPYDSVWICVHRCPDRDIYSPFQLQEYARESGVKLCRYDVPVESYSNSTFFPNTNIGPCPTLPIYRTVPVLNRCVPRIVEASMRNVMSGIFGFLNGVDIFQQVLADLVTSYPTIIACCVFAFILSLLMVFLLRFVAAVIVYVIFAVAALSALAVTGGVWWMYIQLHWDLNAQEVLTNGTQLLISDAKNEHTLLIYAIVASCISVVLLLGVCCCWGSAKLVVDLFEESGRCLTALPFLLLQPLATFVALILLFFAWTLVLLCLATAKGITTGIIDDYWSGGAIQEHIVTFNKSLPIRAVWWYHVAGLIWTAEFFLAAQQMVIAGAVANWYFAKDKNDIGWPVCVSIRQTLLYHAGSLALGSLLITLVKLPRLILMYIQSKMKASESKCAGCCVKGCICCLYAVEKCLRYLHHNAYTIIAMEGQSFCPAARQAVMILANNVVNVAAINAVGDLVLFLAKVSVTALSALLALFLLQRNPELHFASMPLLLICIFAFFIAHCFFSVYEMTIDTLFLCYCADRDLADRTGVEMKADPQLITFMRRSTAEGMSRSTSNVVTVAEPEEIPLNDMSL